MSETSENRSVAVLQPRATVAIGARPEPMVPTNLEGVWRLSELIAASGMAPKDMKEAPQIAVAIMHGLEVGLTPMAALQSIAVVNGRPSVWGDGAIGLVRASGLLEDFDEGLNGEGDKRVAYCKVKRKGEKKVLERTFSWEDAKKAGLTSKTGPWQNYPNRMLVLRARAFALRDQFADVLRGLSIREEMEDVAREDDARDVTPSRPTPIEPPSSETIIDVPVDSGVAPKEAAGQDAEDKPALPPQPSSASTPSPEQPEPPADEPFDWEAVKDDIDEQLKAATEPKHIDEIRDLFAEDVEKMTRSQRSTVEGLFVDAERRLKAQEEEASRQRVEAAGGKGVKEYMDEDRKDAETARAVGDGMEPDPFDPKSYETEDKESIIDLVNTAIKLAKDDGGKEMVTKLYNMFVDTKAIRKKHIDLKTRNAQLDIVAPLFEKHGLLTMQPSFLKRASDVLSRVQFEGFEYITATKGEVVFLQIACSSKCNVTGEPMRWTSRKWMLSEHMTDGEIVQTAFLATKIAIEHELRETFYYKGQPIFDPHYDLDKLHALRSQPDALKERDPIPVRWPEAV